MGVEYAWLFLKTQAQKVAHLNFHLQSIDEWLVIWACLTIEEAGSASMAQSQSHVLSDSSISVKKKENGFWWVASGFCHHVYDPIKKKGTLTLES